jgi:hypothetical protein
MVADIELRTASVYINQEETPLFTFDTWAAGTQSYVLFGDGSPSQIYGEVNLKHIRWTNEEFAAVPEPGWIAPTDGWEHEYVATNQIPEDYDSNWVPTAIGAEPANNPVSIITDGAEGSVLNIKNRGVESPANASYYSMTAAPGSGSSTDMVTLDVRFRLVEDRSEEAVKHQFLVALRRPQPGGGGYVDSYQLMFSQDAIGYWNGSSTYTTTAAPLGISNYNDVRMLADIDAREASVYINQQETPLFTFAPWVTGTQNFVLFGDGSPSLIYGEVNLKHIRWTNEEFAAVPEPGTLGMLVLALSGALVVMRRRLRP